MDPRKPLLKHLTALEKERGAAIQRAQAIARASVGLEKQALADQVRAAKRLGTATGPAREIAEAEYLDATDRKRKAGHAGALARRTLAKLGG